MNIKRIIKEEMDDFGWMHGIKPTLGQMWDEGLISKGDILVLEGHVANDNGNTTKYFDDFKIKIITTLRSISDSKFIPLTKEGSEWVGYNNNPLWFFRTDGNLFVVDYIKAGESLNESDDGLGWIKNELSNKGPLDGIRFRVPRSIASRSINVIEDKDGDSEWVSVFWQTDDKGDIRSERYSREMVERYLSDGWWKRLN